jgi:hypothetical protein
MTMMLSSLLQLMLIKLFTKFQTCYSNQFPLKEIDTQQKRPAEASLFKISI